jgi:hypothetical protein
MVKNKVMSFNVVCRKCGRSHSSQEYLDSKFCRNCGTFLSLPKTRVKARAPSLKIYPKERKSLKVKFRDHPKINRTDVNADIAYFLGLFLARGDLKRESLIIRVPCRSENASDHRDFLLDYVIPRMEKATGEKIRIHGDEWRGYRFNIMISSDFFLRLIATLEYEEGEVCRFAGIPYEIFNANNEAKREFVKGIGDCSGEIDRYIDGSPRVVLRFLNENTKIIEDIVELLITLSVDIFDVNLSPASEHRPDVSVRIDELTHNLESRYGVKVTGRRQRTGRDNMIRIWAEEYYNQIDFNNPLRQTKLLKYLQYL